MNSVDYHFLISTMLYKFLEEVARQYNMTINKLIREFVVISISHVDMLYQNYGRQVRAIYELVNSTEPFSSLFSQDERAKSKDEQEDVHVLFSGDTYYKLKWLQGNLNIFSMAQVVRRCIFFILRMIEEYGTLENAKKALNGMDETIKEIENSKDERGFIQFPESIRHMTVFPVVSYRVIALYIRFMKIKLFGLPLGNE